MAYYNTPEEMFTRRAESYKREGDRHWALAKSGQGDHHYGQARACYQQASQNRAKADSARTAGATWKK